MSEQRSGSQCDVDFELVNAICVAYCFYKKKKNCDNTLKRGSMNNFKLEEYSIP